jgi:hypothetical protein
LLKGQKWKPPKKFGRKQNFHSERINLDALILMGCTNRKEINNTHRIRNRWIKPEEDKKAKKSKGQ